MCPSCFCRGLGVDTARSECNCRRSNSQNHPHLPNQLLAHTWITGELMDGEGEIRVEQSNCFRTIVSRGYPS